MSSGRTPLPTETSPTDLGAPQRGRGDPGAPGSIELSQDDLRAFIEAWGDACGEELSLDEASHHATRLVQWILLMAKPIPGEARSVDPTT